MYCLIQHAPIRWPEKQKHGIEVSNVAKDLIFRLLIKDRKHRLGQKNDVDEILQHPFFEGIDMNLLLERKIQPPYIPKIEPVEFNSALKITESVLEEEQIMKIQAKKDQFMNFGLDNSDQLEITK